MRILYILLLCFSVKTFAAASYLDSSVLVNISDVVSGELEVSLDIEIPLAKSRLCFSFQENTDRFNPLSRVNFFSKSEKIKKSSHASSISVDQREFDLKNLDKNTYCLTKKSKSKNLFKLKMAHRLKFDSHDDPRILDQLMPTFFKTKPNSSADIWPLKIDYRADLVPQNWGLIRSTELAYNQLTLVLIKDAKTEEKKIGGLPVYLVYRSEQFLSLWPEIENILNYGKNWLGPFPFSSLSIVESNVAGTQNFGSVIVLNQPKQGFLSFLQNNVSNWRLWALSSLIFSQWFGQSVEMKNPADNWLASGICDFLTLSFLRNEKQHYNLVNAYGENIHLVYFDYLQFQELSADFLRRRYPKNSLLDEDLNYISRNEECDQLIPTKAFFGFTYLASFSTSEQLIEFFKKTSLKFRHQKITNRDFLRELKEHGPYGKQNLAAERYLRQWWTKENWPDIAIKTATKNQVFDHSWMSRIELSDAGKYDMPVEIMLVGKDAGQHLFAKADVGDKKEATSVVSDFEPVNVIVDPRHKLYDADRFNNSLNGTGVNFYPGSTNTLSNSDYTTIWLPYAIKRAGEPLNLGLNAWLFRYLDQSLFLKFEFSPSNMQAAFNIEKPFVGSMFGQNTRVGFSQDAKGNQLLGLGLASNLSKNQGPKIGVEAQIMAHQTRGVKDSFYPALGLGVNNSADFLAGDLATDSALFIEHSIAGKYSNYSFQRLSAKSDLSIALTARSQLNSEFFYGLLTSFSERVPQATFFSVNDLNEAGLRIDSKKLRPSTQILSIKNDWLFPISLSLPSYFLVVEEKMRASIFIDFGRSFSRPLHNYVDSGVGISLPMGGEFTGIGHLVLQKFSILAILYNQIDDHTDVRLPPDFLFSLSGEF